MTDDRCRYRKFDCFAFLMGRCNACSNTHFGDNCPFYKSADERREGHRKAIDRLRDIGRQDLIKKYGQTVDQSRLWGEI